MTQSLQGMVKGKVFYCRFKRKNSQRHLKESGAEREGSRLKMASKWVWPGEKQAQSGEREEEVKAGGWREHSYEKKLGEGGLWAGGAAVGDTGRAGESQDVGSDSEMCIGGLYTEGAWRPDVLWSVSRHPR